MVQKNASIVGASVIALALIVVAVVFRPSPGADRVAAQSDTAPVLRAVAPDDFARGSESPTVTIVEFSDFECVFCAKVHPELIALVESRDDVRWVYRHFPISRIHSQARRAAIAAECIGRIGGTDTFWQFADTLFANQAQLSDEYMNALRASLNIDEGVYNACIQSEDASAHVDADLEEILSLGGSGTPYFIAYGPSGRLRPFSGAFSRGQLNDIVNDIARE